MRALSNQALAEAVKSLAKVRRLDVELRQNGARHACRLYLHAGFVSWGSSLGLLLYCCGVRVWKVWSRWTGAEWLQGSAGLGDRGAIHFASALNVGVGMVQETERKQWVRKFLVASGEHAEDAGRGVRRRGIEGLGFAANGVGSDGLLAFSDALKGWKESGESDLMLRRLDVRENELGAKVAVALKKVPPCSAPPCARVVFV